MRLAYLLLEFNMQNALSLEMRISTDESKRTKELNVLINCNLPLIEFAYQCAGHKSCDVGEEGYSSVTASQS